MTMESLSLTCSPASSTHELSGKRPPSPDARTPQAKRHKTGLREVQSSREKRRRRKKKKRPMTRDSTGLKRNERTPSLPSDLPFPSTVENCPSLLSPHGSPFDDPSTPPHVHSKPVHMPSPLGSGNRPSASLPSLRQDHGISTSHDENKSLRNHKALLASFISSLVCQICLDLLHKPFSLSPCGHVSCYSCLINWFTVDQRPGDTEGGRIFRKKTCPQCRAVVRERPLEAWNIKDMVATLVKSRLIREFLPSANEAAPGEFVNSGAASHDPWANIFPPVPSHSRPPPLESSPSALGMFDAEDQVYRCLDCMHEIWGDSCSQCGRHYGAHNVDASDDEASGEGLHGMWNILPVMEHIMGWPRIVSADRSEDGSYEASFIDDGEDSDGDISGAVDISPDGDNPVIEVTAVTRQGRDGAGESGDDDEDERIIDVGETSRSVRRRPTIGTRRQVLSDSGETDSDGDDKSRYSVKSGDEDDDGSLARPPMRLFGRVRSQHLFISEGDSGDESSDSDGIDSDGDKFGVQWSGGGFGGLTSEEEVVDEELVNGEPLN